MGEESAIGVDVGGTHIRVGRVNRLGQVSGKIIEPVCRDRQGFTAQVTRLVSTRIDSDSVGIGIGIPGRVSAQQSEILSAGYLDIAGLDLPDIMARETALPVRLENDATMALVAEAHVRGEAARGMVLILTIGTGIGGAMLQDGMPWHGGGVSGQFGHIVVAGDGPVCKCGRTGCVETFSSGTALGELMAEAALPDGSLFADLLKRADSGDAVAAGILHRWASPFRRALDTLVAVIDPQLIICGGGLGAEMVKALERLPLTSGSWFDLPVEAARLADDAGVIGAGLFGLGAVPAVGCGMARPSPGICGQAGDKP